MESILMSGHIYQNDPGDGRISKSQKGKQSKKEESLAVSALPVFFATPGFVSGKSDTRTSVATGESVFGE
jgi:hypothetical protein